jgi:hypothetical protein
MDRDMVLRHLAEVEIAQAVLTTMRQTQALNQQDRERFSARARPSIREIQ